MTYQPTQNELESKRLASEAVAALETATEKVWAALEALGNEPRNYDCPNISRDEDEILYESVAFEIEKLLARLDGKPRFKVIPAQPKENCITV